MEAEKIKNRGSLIQIWLMFLIIGGVLASGFLLIPDTEEDRQKIMSLLGTTNTGEIVSPTVDFSSLFTLPPSESPKWKIIVVNPGKCEVTCVDMTYSMRQVHMLLGKSTRRVERFLLTDLSVISDTTLEAIKSVYPFLNITGLDSSELKQIIGTSTAGWDMLSPRYFVLTPDFEATLFYTADHDPNGLLDDVKHLLKYSPMR